MPISQVGFYPTEGADTPIPVTVLPDLLKSGTLRVPLPVPDLPGTGMQNATSVQLAEDPSQGMHFRVRVDRGDCFVQMQLPSRSLHVRFSLPCGQMALPLTLVVRADGPGAQAAAAAVTVPQPSLHRRFSPGAGRCHCRRSLYTRASPSRARTSLASGRSRR